MNENLIKELDIAEERLGIKEFINKGIKGKGIKIGILGHDKGSYHNGEWQITRNTDIETIIYPVLGKNCISYEEALQKAIDDKIDILLSATCKSSWSETLENQSEKLFTNNVILIDSADNDSREIDSYPALSKWWRVVGVDSGYSNYGDKLDFVLPTNFVNPNQDMTNYIPITHTSGAVPLAGKIVALLKSLYGKQFNTKDFDNYLKNNCLDLKENGKDLRTGYGELHLVYNENMINKDESLEIVLKIGENYITKNGIKIPMDTYPRIIDNRTFVPIRFISEVLGYKIEWNEKTQEVKIIK